MSKISLLVILLFTTCVPELPVRHTEGLWGILLANLLNNSNSDICSLHYSEVTLPQYADAFQEYLQTESAKGSLGTPTIDTTTITGLAGSDKWLGGVLAPNGKIYGIPYGASNALIIAPVTNTTDITLITGLPDIAKWIGGVLAPNGKIYGIPADATNVLIIDPVTNTSDISTLTGLAGSVKWGGGVLAPNGKIYAIPRDAASVSIIDPMANGSYCDGVLLSGYLNKY